MALSFEDKIRPVTNLSFVDKIRPTTPDVQEQHKSGLQIAADITDAIFGGGKIGEYIGTKVGYALASPAERKFYDTSTPTRGELAGSALQAASLFTPVGRMATGITAGARAVGISKGASAIGKIASGAIAGGAFDVASNLQQGKTGAEALKPGLGAGIGGAIPAVGVAKNVIGRAAESQASRVIDSLIKPLAKDFSYGKDPGRAVAEAKIVASSFDDLATKIREARQTTGQEIGALGRKLSTKPVVNIEDALLPLDEAMKTAASQNNPTLLSRLANVKKAITHVMEPSVDDAGNVIIKEVGARKLTGLTFSESRDILGQVGDITQFTGAASDDKAVNSALKQVYGLIKQSSLEAADQIDPALAKQFRSLTEKYADLSSAEIATKYRDKIVQRSNLVGLSPQIAGIGTGLITMVATGGAATPAILAGLTGAVVDKLASTPAFKTRLAAVLSKKSPQEIGVLFQKIPALQKFFPKGSAISPGDRLLQTKVGQKVEKSVVNSIKNPSLGLSIRPVENAKLLSEARKYKTAEEFVKAQPKLYHSGAVDIKEVSTAKSNFSRTFYLSDNADYAKSFGGKGASLNEMVLDPKANLIDLRKPTDAQIKELSDAIGKATSKKAAYGEGYSLYPYSKDTVLRGIKDGKAHFAELPQIKRILKILGYDGQITSEVPYAKNIGVWNKDVIKTKSQLTDIWKKAHNK